MLCIAHFYDPQMVLSAHTPRRLRLPQSPASCLLLPLRLLPPLHADSQMGFGEYRPNSRREEESKTEGERWGRILRINVSNWSWNRDWPLISRLHCPLASGGKLKAATSRTAGQLLEQATESQAWLPRQPAMRRVARLRFNENLLNSASLRAFWSDVDLGRRWKRNKAEVGAVWG